ncbi:proline-rich protein 2-like [Lutra lutra]|uniref:proline-rich protein 2-like n=1 Tax=Lutra lutra TaxID=9657 RepID=UPI001FD0DFDE|nr:proline-rich protein 2-like [Lutra lutra]
MATSKGSLSLVTDPPPTIRHLSELPGAYMLTGSVYTPDKANMRRRVPWAQGQPIMGSKAPSISSGRPRPLRTPTVPLSAPAPPPGPQHPLWAPTVSPLGPRHLLRTPTVSLRAPSILLRASTVPLSAPTAPSGPPAPLGPPRPPPGPHRPPTVSPLSPQHPHRVPTAPSGPPPRPPMSPSGPPPPRSGPHRPPDPTFGPGAPRSEREFLSRQQQLAGLSRRGPEGVRPRPDRGLGARLTCVTAKVRRRQDSAPELRDAERTPSSRGAVGRCRACAKRGP